MSKGAANSRTEVVPKITQPEAMKTKSYVCGVEKVNGNDAWKLFAACAAGDESDVKALLAKDGRLVNAQYWYQFPIHMAVRAGHGRIVELLLKRGADPGQSTYTYHSWDKLLQCAKDRGYAKVEGLLQRAMKRRFNYTPEFEELKAAIVARNIRRIGSILRRSPKLAFAADALGNNALHWSVLTRHLGLIDRFVELGTPIDAKRADGQTPVLLAVNGSDYWYRASRGKSHPSLRNRFVMVGALLGKGAEYTLSVAAAVGDQERVEEILQKEESLARKLDSSRVSPLSYAAQEGHLHIVRLLLERGADPNIPEEAAPRGQALYQSCVKNDLEMANLLLTHGADPNAGVDSCECCLTIGRIYHGAKAKPLEKLLREHGAKFPPYRMSIRQLMTAIRSRDGVMLHGEFFDCVMRTGNIQLVKAYVRADASVPKQISTSATYLKTPAIMQWLLRRGLDPEGRDWMGKTLLHACAENGDVLVAAILLKAGADLNARDVEYQATPLAAAVRAWRGETDEARAKRMRRMVEFLLESGAATNLPDDPPWATPMACARGRDEILELLRRYGATRGIGSEK